MLRNIVAEKQKEKERLKRQLLGSSAAYLFDDVDLKLGVIPCYHEAGLHCVTAQGFTAGTSRPIGS